METELVKVEKINPVKLFTVDGVEPIIAEIRSKVSEFEGDVVTPTGRKKIASMANKVARSKTLLDGLGKNLVSDWKAKSKRVDESRKKLRDELDAIKTEVRKPLTEWEDLQSRKLAMVVKVMSYFRTVLSTDTALVPRSKVELTLKAVKEVEITDIFNQFEEGFEAQELKDKIIERLTRVVDEKIVQEKERMELEKLRQEKAAQEEKERQEAQDNAAKERAEKEAKVKVERAQREAREAEERAKRSEEMRKIEAQKQKERLEAAEKQAAERERLRIEKEKEQERKAQERREANKRHRNKINHESSVSLRQASGIDLTTATYIIEAIGRGEVKNVTINY